MPSRLWQSAAGNVIKAGDDSIFRVQSAEVNGCQSVDTAGLGKYRPWESELPEVKRPDPARVLVIPPPRGEPRPARTPENGEIGRVHYEGRLARRGGTGSTVPYERRFAGSLPVGTRLMKAGSKPRHDEAGDRWDVLISRPNSVMVKWHPRRARSRPNAPLIFEVENDGRDEAAARQRGPRRNTICTSKG